MGKAESKGLRRLAFGKTSSRKLIAKVLCAGLLRAQQEGLARKVASWRSNKNESEEDFMEGARGYTERDEEAVLGGFKTRPVRAQKAERGEVVDVHEEHIHAQAV
jgi:hypothetical protein